MARAEADTLIQDFQHEFAAKFPFYPGVVINGIGVMELTPQQMLLPWSEIFAGEEMSCVFDGINNQFVVSVTQAQLKSAIQKLQGCETFLISTYCMDLEALFNNWSFFNLPPEMLVEHYPNDPILKAALQDIPINSVHLSRCFPFLLSLMRNVPQQIIPLLDQVTHFLLRSLHFLSRCDNYSGYFQSLVVAFGESVSAYIDIVTKGGVNQRLHPLTTRLLAEQLSLCTDMLVFLKRNEDANEMYEIALDVILRGFAQTTGDSLVLCALPCHYLAARQAVRCGGRGYDSACTALQLILNKYLEADLSTIQFFYVWDVLRAARLLNELNAGVAINDVFSEIGFKISYLYLLLQRLVVKLWDQNINRDVLEKILVITLPGHLLMRSEECNDDDIVKMIEFFSIVFIENPNILNYSIKMPLGQSKKINFSEINIFYALLNSNSPRLVGEILRIMRENDCLGDQIATGAKIIMPDGKVQKSLDEVLVLLKEHQPDELFHEKLVLLVQNLVLMPGQETMLGKIFFKFKALLKQQVSAVTSQIIERLQIHPENKVQNDQHVKHTKELFAALCQLLRQENGLVGNIPRELIDFLHASQKGSWPFVEYVDKGGTLYTMKQIKQWPLVKRFVAQGFAVEFNRQRRCLILTKNKFRNITIAPQVNGLLLPSLPVKYMVTFAEMMEQLQSVCGQAELLSGDKIAIPMCEVCQIKIAQLWTEDSLWERSDCKRRLDHATELEPLINSIRERIVSKECDVRPLQKLLDKFTYHDCLELTLEQLQKALRGYDEKVEAKHDAANTKSFEVTGKDGKPVKIKYRLDGHDFVNPTRETSSLSVKTVQDSDVFNKISGGEDDLQLVHRSVSRFASFWNRNEPVVSANAAVLREGETNIWAMKQS